MEFYEGLKYPKQLCRLHHPDYVEILKDELTATYSARGHHTDVGAVRSVIPAPSNCQIYYFEVKILNAGSSSKICIGLTKEGCLLNRAPGSGKNSIGYRSEDGRKFRSPRNHAEAYGPPYGSGDVVGCGIHYSQNYIFFTKNGYHLGEATSIRSTKYYPTVGMHTNGERVKFNFTGPFVFDLQLLIESELLDERRNISKVECNKAVFDDLVLSHLLHGGYEETYNALKAALKESKSENNKNGTIEESVKEDKVDESVKKEVIGVDSEGVAATEAEGVDTPTASELLVGAEDEGMVGTTEGEVSGDTKQQTDSSTRTKGRSWYEFEYTDEVEEKLVATLSVRKRLRDLVSRGDILEAIDVLKEAHPSFFNEERASTARALLLSQQVIEYMRPPNPDALAAVSWMRAELAGYRDSSPITEEILSECAALISLFDKTNAADDPLYDRSRNILVADTLNEAILAFECETPKWTPLALNIRQLVACKQVLRELSGNMGAIPTSRSLCQPLVRKHRKTDANTDVKR